MNAVFRIAQLCAVLGGAFLIMQGFPVLGLCVALMACGSCLLDRLVNRVAPVTDKPIADESVRFHNGCFIADLHADVCLWRRDHMRRNWRGHVDLPRLHEGNVALQFVTVPTKLVISPRFPRLFLADLFFWGALVSLQRPDTWFSAPARVRLQLSRLARWVATSEGKIGMVRTRGEFIELKERRERNEDVIGVMLGLEGAHVLRGGLDVPWLAAQGFCVVGITHFNDTRFGDSAHGVRMGGLKPAGRELVRQLEKYSITVDLAHASAALIEDILEMHREGELSRPLLVSHTGIKGVYDHRRNISDSQAVAIAATGGLIGITLFAPGLPRADLAALGESIGYLVRLLDDAGLEGARHVAIGSDFDGAVRTVVDAAGWPRITAELLKSGYGLSREQVELIVGGNIRNFFIQNLPA
ncbi:MAG: membrane dipeptidase [Verrucomicrobiales bacterium]